MSSEECDSKDYESKALPCGRFSAALSFPLLAALKMSMRYAAMPVFNLMTVELNIVMNLLSRDESLFA